MNIRKFSPGSSLLEAENYFKSDSCPENFFVGSLTVPNLISARIAESPSALALEQAGREVSYGELDRKARAIASRLRSSGVGPGQPVGVYFESSIDMVAAALGVWQAGGAYLPIDPAYPAERAQHILADSGAAVVIARSETAPALSGGSWTTLLIEDIPDGNEEQFEGELQASSENLAYIIYTSGSTGQPKGVEITHGNLSNLVQWHLDQFQVTPDDRATQIAGPGFDAAVWELWPYLAAGASIHIPTAEARLSAKKLQEWLLTSKITISFAPTVLAEQLLRFPWPANTSLRTLLTGGDALHTYPPANLPFALVNNYGPTECTVVATSGLVGRRALDESAPSIGKAIRNTSIFLLNEDGREVTDGIAGEICIAGPSVGRGYRNLPELTAEKFAVMEVGGTAQRVFRTGDLAKRLPDGQLAFAGRADDQIKIRGFRIEPEEIAVAINRHPSVVSSAVIARTDGGEKRLVAYVVAAAGVELLERDLRDLLTKSLPDYMVPANFVLLDRIPVTANGKLDKAALPSPTDKNQLRRDNYVAPRNELEEIVEGILSPILGLERVSIHDNFFLLGGHSLMGAQVIAKVRDIFDVELNLRNVFESPTVAKLAAKIEASLTSRLESMSEEEVHQALRKHVASDVVPGRAKTQAG